MLQKSVLPPEGIVLVGVPIVSGEPVRQPVSIQSSRVPVGRVIRHGVAVQGRRGWRRVPVIRSWVPGCSRVASRESTRSVHTSDHWVPVNDPGEPTRWSDRRQGWRRSTREPTWEWSSGVAIVVGGVSVTHGVAVAHGVVTPTGVPVHGVPVHEGVAVVRGMVPVAATTKWVPLRSTRSRVAVVTREVVRGKTIARVSWVLLWESVDLVSSGVLVVALN